MKQKSTLVISLEDLQEQIKRYLAAHPDRSPDQILFADVVAWVKKQQAEIAKPVAPPAKRR